MSRKSMLGSCGLMDKASDFGSEDCRFESCHDRKSFFLSFKAIWKEAYLSEKWNLMAGCQHESCHDRKSFFLPFRAIKKEAYLSQRSYQRNGRKKNVSNFTYCTTFLSKSNAREKTRRIRFSRCHFGSNCE